MPSSGASDGLADCIQAVHSPVFLPIFLNCSILSFRPGHFSQTFSTSSGRSTPSTVSAVALHQASLYTVWMFSGKLCGQRSPATDQQVQTDCAVGGDSLVTMRPLDNYLIVRVRTIVSSTFPVIASMSAVSPKKDPSLKYPSEAPARSTSTSPETTKYISVLVSPSQNTYSKQSTRSQFAGRGTKARHTGCNGILRHPSARSRS